MTARKYRSPEHERAYAAFNSWMRRPDLADRYDDLRAAMNEHELKDRLRRLLPEVRPLAERRVAGLQGLPVEEVTFANPNHRSTRLEFLADCSTYGA